MGELRSLYPSRSRLRLDLPPPHTQTQLHFSDSVIGSGSIEDETLLHFGYRNRSAHRNRLNAEPSTFILLGRGLIGAAYFVRRRVAPSNQPVIAGCPYVNFEAFDLPAVESNHLSSVQTKSFYTPSTIRKSLSTLDPSATRAFL